MTPEKKREIAKTVVKWIVSTSAGATASAALKTNLPATNRPAQKAAFVIGAFVIGSMTQTKAKEWADSEVDEIYELIDKARGKSEEDTPEE
jgi:nitrous oxide reductase accessory protein NosL